MTLAVFLVFHVMSDKRKQARVQGAWARQTGTTVPVRKHPEPPTVTAASWGISSQKTPQTFEFQPPTKPIRDVPQIQVIEKGGEYEISHEPSGVSRLLLLPGFLPPEDADWIFSQLLAELPWSQKTNYRQGEAYAEPRLTCWFGDLPYTYSGSTMAANPQWPPLLQRLRQAVSQHCGCSFNSLLCNLYRDGHDSIGWHSDDEASLGCRPNIASLSLGDTRVFSLRKIPPPEEEGDYMYVEQIRVPLSHGTLLLMSGSTQDDWQHQVAKEYHDRGPRINLTFRSLHPEPQGHRAGADLAGSEGSSVRTRPQC